MIRATKHSLKFTNSGKRRELMAFINEYRRVAGMIVSDIWNNGYKQFDVKTKNYDLPKYLDYNDFNIQTDLSARALSSLVTQLSGVIRACTDKQKRRCEQYKLTPTRSLLKAINKFKTSLPETSQLNPELSSKCVDFKTTQGKFYGFLRLKSIGKSYGHIKLPIQTHRVNKKYNDWNLKNSFLITSDYVNLRWEKDVPPRLTGKVVGADQGQTTCLSLSDTQVTTPNLHGHDLSSICNIMARKKRGSKSFRRAQEHRKNYINWSINQLNFDNIKEIRFENIHNLFKGRNTSKSLKHFSYTLIDGKLERHAELLGVQVTKQNSAFRSQRCAECGWVQKSNRNGKLFSCKSCNHSADADINAARNHKPDLPPVWNFVKSGLNKSGFYWNPDGVFDRFGQELRVPDNLQSQ